MAATETRSTLEVQNVSKTFGATTVLRNADLKIRPGEIHGLIGANGAGKSTLVKCITGVYPPDQGGSIKVAGMPAPPNYSPTIATEMGVRVVHQEAPVVGILTVAEVAGLQRGFPKFAGSFIRWRKLRRETEEILSRLNVGIPPAAHAGRLTAGQRAMVMLALALADVDKGARLLVLDEATASLPAQDADRFLAAVKQAAGFGVGILLVTHRLSEIFTTANRVTVVRDGRVTWTGDVTKTSHEELVRELIGPDTSGGLRDASRVDVRRSTRFEPAPKPDQRSAEKPALKVEGLTGSIVSGISFSMQPGELLGVTGITGSGGSELGRLIAGIVPRRGGVITFAGKELPVSFGPRQALARGIVYVPADRLSEGGIPTLSVRENLVLPDFGRYWLRRGLEQRDLHEVLSVLDIRPPNPQKQFHELSGGNQQKVIIGKWALLRPRLFVLDDPTTGVDPGAREELYAVLRGLLKAGTAILFISSEPEQLERLAPRVLVLRNGVVRKELRDEAVTEEAITSASL
jgi:ribose transport system ATP-binding protein